MTGSSPQPIPTPIVFKPEDAESYENKINPDIMAPMLAPSLVYEAINGVTRWRYNAVQIHLHPAAYDDFVSKCAGTQEGYVPSVSLGHRRPQIVGLDPQISTKIPQNEVYIVAELPQEFTTSLEEQDRHRMIQRVILVAPVDVKARLVSLFYQLLRDKIPAAELEEVIQEDEALMWNKIEGQDGRLSDARITYSNPFLRDYAIDLANRVLGMGVSQVLNRRIHRDE